MRRRHLVGAAALALGLLLALALLGDSGADPADSARRSGASSPATTPPALGDSVRRVPAQYFGGLADIEVDPPAICQGAASLIRVTPVASPGGDRWLSAIIDGDPGWHHVFEAGTTGDPGPREVLIRMWDLDRRTYVEERVAVDVLDCVAPTYLRIVVSDDPLDPAFEARSFRAVARPGAAAVAWGHRSSADQGGPPPALAVASWSWDFGDDTRLITPDDRVRHRFPPERERDPADGAVSQYLVQVEGFDATGASLGVARTSVTLPNYYRALRHESGIIQLPASYVPVARATDHGMEVPFTVSNLDGEETAVLDTLIYQVLPCATGGAAVERRGRVADLLDQTAVAPGSERTGVLRWSEDDPDACSVIAQLSGRSTPAGLPVHTEVRMFLRPGPDAVRTRNPEVVDILSEAMRASGQSGVSLADVARLEETGELPPGSVDKVRAAR